MMKNSIYTMCLAVATLLASCGSDNDTSTGVGRDVKLVMSVGQPKIATKVLLTDSELNGNQPGVTSVWTASDRVIGLPLFENGTVVTLAKPRTNEDTNRESFVGSTYTDILLDKQEYAFIYPAERVKSDAAMLPLDFSKQSGGDLQSLTKNMFVAWAKTKCVQDTEKEFHLSDINSCNHKAVYSSEAEHDEYSNVVLFDNKFAIVRFTLVVDKDDENANHADGVTGDGKCCPITHVIKVTITDDNSPSRLIGKVELNKATGIVSKITSGEQNTTFTLDAKTESSWIGQPLNYSSEATSQQNKSWGLSVYMAFPCSEYNEDEEHPATLTFKPLITVTTTKVDENGEVATDGEGNPVTKDYYCFLKERTLNEGFYYRTTAIHCYSQKIQAQLEIAEWLEGGYFEDTQEDW